jgi:hypothetical protein
MMRHLELMKKGLCWYKSSGGKTYGGSGIQSQVFLDQIIPVNSKELEQLTGWVEFDLAYHPCRQDSLI